MMLRRLIFALVVAGSAIGAAAAQSPIVGVASVIDGDTLEIHGQRIRLHGIDAPESRQFCEKDGKQYRCGQQAALALSDKICRATIRCEQRDIDRYKRSVAVCRLGNVDINASMVREGWAIAYLQYDPITHHGNAIRHSQGLALIMGNINKCNAYLLLNGPQFCTHMLAQFEVKRG